MSRYLKTALWILVPSGVVAVVNIVAMRADPDHWGGPTSIGAGAVQLLAYCGLAVGVGFLVVAGLRRKRPRSSR